MVRTFDEIIAAEKLRKKKNIAVAGAADTAAIEAVRTVEEELGISNCILIGSKDGILKAAETVGYNVKRENIVEAKSDIEASTVAVSLVRSGEAHLPMKGNIQTPDYLKPMLNKETGLRGKGALSHVGIFEKPGGGLFILTDAAMTMFPDFNGKIGLINNAVDVMRRLGCDKPKVAMLSFLEHVNVVSEASKEAAILSKMAERGQIKNCIVDGPLAFDNALYEEAAVHKGIISPVAGKADIIIVSNIDVGNPLSKALTMMAGLRFGGLIAGAVVPVIMTPRADPVTSKINSIALCQYMLG